MNTQAAGDKGDAKAEDGKSSRPAKARRPAFTFTDPGCRWEVRLGLLLVLGASFLWAWLGPETAKKVLLCGTPLLLFGVPLQAWQARRGRPGYPLKMGLILVAIGAVMTWDLAYREVVGGGIRFPPTPLIILATGTWLLALSPVALIGVNRKETVDGA